MNDNLGSIVHATELRNLEIAHSCVNLVCNLEIGIQFPDSDNTQYNLKFAQIPRLYGTNVLTMTMNT